MVVGHSGQFTPGGYLSTAKNAVLAGIEPTTFRLLVRRATSSAIPRPPTAKVTIIDLYRNIQRRMSRNVDMTLIRPLNKGQGLLFWYQTTNRFHIYDFL